VRRFSRGSLVGTLLDGPGEARVSRCRVSSSRWRSCLHRRPPPRGLALATATTSATFFPQLEQRMRAASARAHGADAGEASMQSNSQGRTVRGKCVLIGAAQPSDLACKYRRKR
jgi:hypothetical protein